MHAGSRRESEFSSTLHVTHLAITFREASSLDTEPKYKNIAAGLPHDIKGHL